MFTNNKKGNPEVKSVNTMNVMEKAPEPIIVRPSVAPVSEIKKSSTVISRGIKLEAAKLTGSESVEIDGEFIGDIEIDNLLTIGKTGSIVGNINIKNIEIEGTVNGNIYCRGIVRIKAAALINGNIETQSLIIDDGAQFNGKCQMIEVKQPEAAPPVAAPADGKTMTPAQFVNNSKANAGNRCSIVLTKADAKNDEVLKIVSFIIKKSLDETKVFLGNLPQKVVENIPLDTAKEIIEKLSDKGVEFEIV